MTINRAQQKGYLLIAVVAIFFALGVTTLLFQTGIIVASTSRQFSTTQNTIAKISDSLLSFVTINKRLPCPARPDLSFTNPAAGFPDGTSNPAFPAVADCTYPEGVVPWVALGLKADDVTDEWGRLISYRVYDGPYGLTQLDGASALNCDTNNATTPATPPGATGLCNADYNTLAGSFLAYGPTPQYQKGRSVSDFALSVTDVAYLLISHGPSGLGAYLSDGARVPPSVTSTDYPNSQAVPTQFVKTAASGPGVMAGAVGHFDDVVGYLRIGDLLSKAKLSARDWPEVQMPTFSPSTTFDMTAPSTDPFKPHFTTTGPEGSGQEFVATTIDGDTTVAYGSAGGSYSGCLWWPSRLALVNGTTRRSLVAYMEFAAVDNPSDQFPGLTMGFLSGVSPAGPPSNGTCGTTVALTTTAIGIVDEDEITVDSITGLQVGMNAFGAGIDPAATIDDISGLRVKLNSKNIGPVSGTVQFSDSRRIRRDIGWAGGTLAANYTNRFAVEFDANRDTGFSGPPIVPTAADPALPHLAVDFGGVLHGLDAEPCIAIGSGLGCDSETTVFPSVSKIATGTSGEVSITVTDATGVSGIVHGMSVFGDGIAPGATVTAMSSNVITLSLTNTGTVNGSVTFLSLNTRSFMQNGLNVFHSIRTEIYPKDCRQTVGSSGVAGATTITVSDASQIEYGMTAYGLGIASGATVRGISGTTISLSVANSAAVSGPLVFGGSATPATTGTGVAGQNTIGLANANGISVGMTVFGTGISSGVTVTAISDLTIALSANNVGDVSGTIAFTGATSSLQTLMKAWTLSNAGCNADLLTCHALQNINARFSVDVSANRQVMHAVSCIPAATPATAYDTLYFGITTANRTTGNTTGNNVVFRRLSVTDASVLP